MARNSPKVLCTEQKIEEIAQAIREKKHVSVKYTLDEMPPAIRSINPVGTTYVTIATTTDVTANVAWYENAEISLQGAADIIPEHILSGVSFLGVTGSVTVPTFEGSATPADVRSNVTFYGNSSVLLTGSMPDSTPTTSTTVPSGTTVHSLTPGYYINIGSGYVDPSLAGAYQAAYPASGSVTVSPTTTIPINVNPSIDIDETHGYTSLFTITGVQSTTPSTGYYIEVGETISPVTKYTEVTTQAGYYSDTIVTPITVNFSGALGEQYYKIKPIVGSANVVERTVRIPNLTGRWDPPDQYSPVGQYVVTVPTGAATIVNATVTSPGYITSVASATIYLESPGAFGIPGGVIVNNITSGTPTATIDMGKNIKIGAGYYPEDVYYTAEMPANGTVTVPSTPITYNPEVTSQVAYSGGDSGIIIGVYPSEFTSTQPATGAYLAFSGQVSAHNEVVHATVTAGLVPSDVKNVTFSVPFTQGETTYAPMHIAVSQSTIKDSGSAAAIPVEVGEYVYIPYGFNTETTEYYAQPPVMDGTAIPSHVLIGETFFSDTLTKQTGTMPTVSFATHSTNPSQGLNYSADDSASPIYATFESTEEPNANTTRLFVKPILADGSLGTGTDVNISVQEYRYLFRRCMNPGEFATYQWELWSIYRSSGVTHARKLKVYDENTKIAFTTGSPYAASTYYVVSQTTPNNLNIPQEIIPAPVFMGTIAAGQYLSLTQGYNEENRYFQAGMPAPGSVTVSPTTTLPMWVTLNPTATNSGASALFTLTPQSTTPTGDYYITVGDNIAANTVSAQVTTGAGYYANDVVTNITVSIPAEATTTYYKITPKPGDVASNDYDLEVKPDATVGLSHGTPPLTPIIMAASIPEQHGMYILVSGGNTAKTGETATVTKTMGWITSGTFGINSHALSSSTISYYTVKSGSVRVPETISLTPTASDLNTTMATVAGYGITITAESTPVRPASGAYIGVSGYLHNLFATANTTITEGVVFNEVKQSDIEISAATGQTEYYTFDIQKGTISANSAEVVITPSATINISNQSTPNLIYATTTEPDTRTYPYYVTATYGNLSQTGDSAVVTATVGWIENTQVSVPTRVAANSTVTYLVIPKGTAQIVSATYPASTVALSVSGNTYTAKFDTVIHGTINPQGFIQTIGSNTVSVEGVIPTQTKVADTTIITPDAGKLLRKVEIPFAEYDTYYSEATLLNVDSAAVATVKGQADTYVYDSGWLSWGTDGHHKTPRNVTVQLPVGSVTVDPSSGEIQVVGQGVYPTADVQRASITLGSGQASAPTSGAYLHVNGRYVGSGTRGTITIDQGWVNGGTISILATDVDMNGDLYYPINLSNASVMVPTQAANDPSPSLVGKVITVQATPSVTVATPGWVNDASEIDAGPLTITTTVPTKVLTVQNHGTFNPPSGFLYSQVQVAQGSITSYFSDPVLSTITAMGTISIQGTLAAGVMAEGWLETGESESHSAYVETVIPVGSVTIDSTYLTMSPTAKATIGELNNAHFTVSEPTTTKPHVSLPYIKIIGGNEGTDGSIAHATITEGWVQNQTFNVSSRALESSKTVYYVINTENAHVQIPNGTTWAIETPTLSGNIISVVAMPLSGTVTTPGWMSDWSQVVASTMTVQATIPAGSAKVNAITITPDNLSGVWSSSDHRFTVFGTASATIGTATVTQQGYIDSVASNTIYINQPQSYVIDEAVNSGTVTTHTITSRPVVNVYGTAGGFVVPVNPTSHFVTLHGQLSSVGSSRAKAKGNITSAGYAPTATSPESEADEIEIRASITGSEERVYIPDGSAKVTKATYTASSVELTESSGTYTAKLTRQIPAEVAPAGWISSVTAETVSIKGTIPTEAFTVSEPGLFTPTSGTLIRSVKVAHGSMGGGYGGLTITAVSGAGVATLQGYYYAMTNDPGWISLGEGTGNIAFSTPIQLSTGSAQVNEITITPTALTGRWVSEDDAFVVQSNASTTIATATVTQVGYISSVASNTVHINELSYSISKAVNSGTVTTHTITSQPVINVSASYEGFTPSTTATSRYVSVQGAPTSNGTSRAKAKGNITSAGYAPIATSSESAADDLEIVASVTGSGEKVYIPNGSAKVTKATYSASSVELTNAADVYTAKLSYKVPGTVTTEGWISAITAETVSLKGTIPTEAFTVSEPGLFTPTSGTLIRSVKVAHGSFNGGYGGLTITAVTNPGVATLEGYYYAMTNDPGWISLGEGTGNIAFSTPIQISTGTAKVSKATYDASSVVLTNSGDVYTAKLTSDVNGEVGTVGWISSVSSDTVSIKGTIPTQAKTPSTSGDITPDNGKLLHKVTIRDGTMEASFSGTTITGVNATTGVVTIKGEATAHNVSAGWVADDTMTNITTSATIAIGSVSSNKNSLSLTEYASSTITASSNAITVGAATTTPPGLYVTVTSKATNDGPDTARITKTTGWIVGGTFDISATGTGATDVAKYPITIKSGSATASGNYNDPSPALSGTNGNIVTLDATVTPSVTEGWVSSGTGGVVSITATIPVEVGKTITGSGTTSHASGKLISSVYVPSGSAVADKTELIVDQYVSCTTITVNTMAITIGDKTPTPQPGFTYLTVGTSATGTDDVAVVTKSAGWISAGAITITASGSGGSGVDYYPISISPGSAKVQDQAVTPGSIGNPIWDSNGYYKLTQSSKTISITGEVIVAGWITSVGNGTLTVNSVSKTIPQATFALNQSLPSGSASSGTNNAGSYVKIKGGYYPSDRYFYSAESDLSADTPADTGDVLAGKEFYVGNTTLKTGTMPNNGAYTATISTQYATIAIPAGYHNGNGWIKASINTGAAKVIERHAQIPEIQGSWIPPVGGNPGCYNVSVNSAATIVRATVTTTGYIATIGSATIHLDAPTPLEIPGGVITNNVTTGTPTGMIDAGKKIKIGAGYYPDDVYYSTEAHPVLSGDADPAHVLEGETFYSDSYTQQTGTMPRVSLAKTTLSITGTAQNSSASLGNDTTASTAAGQTPVLALGARSATAPQSGLYIQVSGGASTITNVTSATIEIANSGYIESTSQTLKTNVLGVTNTGYYPITIKQGSASIPNGTYPSTSTSLSGDVLTLQADVTPEVEVGWVPWGIPGTVKMSGTVPHGSLRTTSLSISGSATITTATIGNSTTATTEDQSPVLVFGTRTASTPSGLYIRVTGGARSQTNVAAATMAIDEGYLANSTATILTSITAKSDTRYYPVKIRKGYAQVSDQSVTPNSLSTATTSSGNLIISQTAKTVSITGTAPTVGWVSSVGSGVLTLNAPSSVTISAGQVSLNVTGGTSSGVIQPGKQICINPGYYATQTWYEAGSGADWTTWAQVSNGSGTMDSQRLASLYVYGASEGWNPSDIASSVNYNSNTSSLSTSPLWPYVVGTTPPVLCAGFQNNTSIAKMLSVSVIGGANHRGISIMFADANDYSGGPWDDPDDYRRLTLSSGSTTAPCMYLVQMYVQATTSGGVTSYAIYERHIIQQIS